MNNTNDWLPFLEWDSVNNARSGGISLSMINDQERNSFYEKSISKNCKDCVCVDIGAGNGLLTFLAIKHGAKHVYCFEHDQFTCHLLAEVAKDLGFFKKITIINKSFKLSEFNLHSWSHGKPEFIIHEIVSDRIFNDNIPFNIVNAFNCVLPNLTTVIPSNYICNIFSVNINEKIFDILIRQSKKYKFLRNQQDDFVSTGVSTEFDFALQKYRTNYLNLPYNEIFTDDNTKLKILRKNSEFVSKINFDINEKKEFPKLFSLTLNPSNHYRVIFLQFKLGHTGCEVDFNLSTNTNFGLGTVYAIKPVIDTLNIDTKKGTIWFEHNG